MKKIIALILSAVLCLSLCACGSSKVEGKGYKSPEEALLAYADALKSGDVSKILSTFAVETFVKNYDLEAYLDTVRVYSPSNIYLENDSSFAQDLNIVARQNVITKQLYNMYAYLSLGPEYAVNLIPFSGNYDDADDFLDDFVIDDWMDILSEMKYDDDFTYLDDLYEDDMVEKAEDMLDDRCDMFGCEKLATLALEIELDGEDYLICMDVGCYDGKWYNLSHSGTIGSLLGVPSMAGGLCSDY